MHEADSVRAEGTARHHHLQLPSRGSFAKLGGRQMPSPPPETTFSFLSSSLEVPLGGLQEVPQRLRVLVITP